MWITWCKTGEYPHPQNLEEGYYKTYLVCRKSQIPLKERTIFQKALG